jgi:hypothetical protein
VADQEADTKRERLVELENRMKEHFAHDFPDPNRWLWFFKGDDKVAGYLGIDPVMFVGQRPSTGKGGLSPVAIGGFYRLLVDYGFANAHVTDLVKEGMKVGTPSDEQVEWNWRFFKEELEIIRPKVIVALGNWVHWVLEQRIPYVIPIERIMHYSYRFIPSPEREKRLREGLARIRRKVDATPGNCCRGDDH